MRTNADNTTQNGPSAAEQLPNRRQVLRQAGGIAALAALSPILTHPGAALAGGKGALLPDGQKWLALLGTSMRTEHDYMARIEGTLPPGLTGTLYRNGPGLFERGGLRKRNLLDGDGMIQAFDFAAGKVRFRNRFVRTEKFKAEEKAGKFLHPTWSTLAPGWFANLGGAGARSQAGVTVIHRDGKLLAFDEVDLPYALDPKTLETKGAYQVGSGTHAPYYKAHTKIDGRTGDWVLIGVELGRQMRIHVVIRDAKGRLKKEFAVTSPRSTYIHDFCITERHVVVLLHALSFSPFGMLAGLNSFIDGLSWAPDLGNLIFVLDRDGGAKPRIVEAPPAFMWHAINAYELDGAIIADFVGYDAPDHFIGENPALVAIMQGRQGEAKHPGKIRRYHIAPGRSRAEETIIDHGTYEFPIIDPGATGHRHRTGYFTTADGPAIFHNAVARLDVETSKGERFSFGPRAHVGEPVLAPGPDGGWLLAEVLDGASGRSYLAIFRARALADGPVAKVHLTHHVPLSFHGYWHGRDGVA